MKTRIISGAVLVVILAATLIPGGPVLCAFLYACSLVGMYEMYKALGVIPGDRQITALAAAGFAGATFFYLILFLFGEMLYGAAAAAAV
ncbi:MAG: phosphatidate cytidylyltransferase, partial [Lachnospiraceae bacterium]|nr:phosphatidate cytidylyltransferase [Lachnospiraceae bacterium]